MTHSVLSEIIKLPDYLYCELQCNRPSTSSDYSGFIGRIQFLQEGQQREVILQKKVSGKPYLSIDNKIIGYSLSHTRDCFLLGVNRIGEIGVDIELIDRAIHPKLMSRISGQDESWAPDTNPIQIWTIKEAVLKLTGTGLRTNMNKVNLQQLNERNFKVHHDNKDISIVSLQLNGYWISVAWTSTF